MRILIVEDDPSLGIFLERGLKLQGHDMHLVGDGELALSRLSQESFDLIVLDLGLPRKDGTDVLAEMQSLQVGCLHPGADRPELGLGPLALFRAWCGRLRAKALQLF